MEPLRVLVTDDEMGMRLGVERTLRHFRVTVPDVVGELGFLVDQADSGEAALRKIEQQPPDILLLDHKMPGISGLDVLDRLTAMKVETLAIMITAYASIETAVAATKRGAYDFLAKPFTPEELKSTIRKAAARIALARQARQLHEEKRQVRFQFIRVLAHELKAPLAAVEGFLEMMQERTLGESAANYDELLGRSKSRIAGMQKLIADLLDMTQIESGQKRRSPERVDLRDLAQRILEAHAAAAAAAGVVLDLHAEPGVQMTADRGEIEMLLNNLISNAIKYNRPGGRVDVTVARRDGGATITVADTGIGMSEEETGRLFGEFVRLRNEKTKGIPGSGLGLSIVRKLAQLYEGDVQVASEPDFGSTFTVTLCDARADDAPQG